MHCTILKNKVKVIKICIGIELLILVGNRDTFSFRESVVITTTKNREKKDVLELIFMQR